MIKHSSPLYLLILIASIGFTPHTLQSAAYILQSILNRAIGEDPIGYLIDYLKNNKIPDPEKKEMLDSIVEKLRTITYTISGEFLSTADLNRFYAFLISNEYKDAQWNDIPLREAVAIALFKTIHNSYLRNALNKIDVSPKKPDLDEHEETAINRGLLELALHLAEPDALTYRVNFIHLVRLSKNRELYSSIDLDLLKSIVYYMSSAISASLLALHEPEKKRSYAFEPLLDRYLMQNMIAAQQKSLDAIFKALKGDVGAQYRLLKIVQDSSTSNEALLKRTILTVIQQNDIQPVLGKDASLLQRILLPVVQSALAPLSMQSYFGTDAAVKILKTYVENGDWVKGRATVFWQDRWEKESKIKIAVDKNGYLDFVRMFKDLPALQEKLKANIQDSSHVEKKLTMQLFKDQPAMQEKLSGEFTPNEFQQAIVMIGSILVSEQNNIFKKIENKEDPEAHIKKVVQEVTNYIKSQRSSPKEEQLSAQLFKDQPAMQEKLKADLSPQEEQQSLLLFIDGLTVYEDTSFKKDTSMNYVLYLADLVEKVTATIKKQRLNQLVSEEVIKQHETFLSQAYDYVKNKLLTFFIVRSS